jgi:hypothetical protein
MKEKTAMQRRKWDLRNKAIIVMEGLRGRPIPTGWITITRATSIRH